MVAKLEMLFIATLSVALMTPFLELQPIGTGVGEAYDGMPQTQKCGDKMLIVKF